MVAMMTDNLAVIMGGSYFGVASMVDNVIKEQRLITIVIYHSKYIFSYDIC
jgi:hypothetical protein